MLGTRDTASRNMIAPPRPALIGNLVPGGIMLGLVLGLGGGAVGVGIGLLGAGVGILLSDATIKYDIQELTE
ncbi:MAG: hypothetical protein GX610_04455 [Rhodococcus sp.]|nr:hypothetical protein [Rhodococcus sp. (in: high G+C Gram-positive bacteria)]